MKIIKKIVNWARIKSPWILHFNSGACNACDIEIIATLTPRYDLERFGVQLKGTPRHADILVCSGPVTREVECRLKRIYDQMVEPKFVVAVGTCACRLAAQTSGTGGASAALGGVAMGWHSLRARRTVHQYGQRALRRASGTSAYVGWPVRRVWKVWVQTHVVWIAARNARFAAPTCDEDRRPRRSRSFSGFPWHSTGTAIVGGTGMLCDMGV